MKVQCVTDVPCACCDHVHMGPNPEVGRYYTVVRVWPKDAEEGHASYELAEIPMRRDEGNFYPECACQFAEVKPSDEAFTSQMRRCNPPVRVPVPMPLVPERAE
jgi:hypothetical protein